MGSRLKEDEKNEKIIRGLLKQPANRKCINCNMLGPQYACTTFSTFICTTCSGIHREFTHRVKSVSMAKFTPQEIASLQAGGNERAREIYFKEWDPQRNFPDSNNVDRLRDFIKHVYVHRRYTSERSSDRAPQVDKEEANGNRRSDAYRSGSQSPAYDDTYQRRYNDRASPGYDVRRSPGYEQDSKIHSDLRKSPVPSAVLNDWRREDRFSNGRKSGDRRSFDGESKSEIKSPDSQKDSDISSPPMVRPVRDILGDNVVPLRISEPPKKNDSSRIIDGPTFTQRTASSSSLASSNGNAAEVKKEISLIDFDAEPEPPFMAGEPQVQQSTAGQSVGQSTQGDDNWAFPDNIQENQVSQTPPSSESLESVLPQLSFPAAPTSGNGAFPTPSNGLFPSSIGGNLQFASAGNVSTVGFNGVPSFPTGSSNQGLTGSSAAHASQAVAPLAAQTREDKSSGMKELPVDLFASTYFVGPYQAPGWQAGPVPGMGYPMQYNPAMSMATFPQPSQPSNPFDAAAAAPPTSATVFPSMSSLHAALPNMEGPRGLAQTATPSWISPQSSSYPLTVPSLGQSFGSPMPAPKSSGTYMGQQLPSTMAPSRPQGFGAFGSEAVAPFASLNTAAVATPNPPVGGNPFD